jgi:hypothetical protein
VDTQKRLFRMQCRSYSGTSLCQVTIALRFEIQQRTTMNNSNMPRNQTHLRGKHPRGSVRESQLEHPSVMKPLFSVEYSNTTVFSRKRSVRFEEDSSTCQVKRRVIEVESMLSMSDEEKSKLWFQRSEENSARASMASVVSDCQRDDNVNFLTYAETLAETYLACCIDGDVDGDTGSSFLKLDPESVVLLGMNHGDARGLEAYTLPLMTEDRVWRRLECVHNVIRLYQGLKLMGRCEPTSEIVADYSAALSVSSRRFARALGVADATAALFEYATSACSNECDHDSFPASKKPRKEKG